MLQSNRSFYSNFSNIDKQFNKNSNNSNNKINIQNNNYMDFSNCNTEYG